MLILFDVGNTAVTCGVYGNGRLIYSESMIYDNIPKFNKKCIDNGWLIDSNVIISSVVPNLTQFINRLFSQKAKIWIAGKSLPVPLKHRYKTKKLGIDRIVNAYGALRIYKPPLLLIDYGTAATFDYISLKGIFEGGMIIPGPEIAFQALLKKAALLPKHMRLPQKASSFLGRNTLECMTSGILYGYASMTDGLIERFKKKFGSKIKVIATGGFSTHLKPYLESVSTVDPLHTIKSLLILYKDHVSSRNKGLR